MPTTIIMTKTTWTIISIIIILSLVSCNSLTIKPNHYTDEFSFTDQNGKQNKFYGFKNLDSAKHWATLENKRILLMFSCYGCMDKNGKEWDMLSYYGDNSTIQNNFILCWLPVDDKTPLKDTLRFPFERYAITTVGLYNYYRQTQLTETCTQPTMCFIDSIGGTYGDNLTYTRDKLIIKQFIESGLDQNTKRKVHFTAPQPTQCEWVEGDTL
jgi:hypothetical protein